MSPFPGPQKVKINKIKHKKENEKRKRGKINPRGICKTIL